MKNTDLLKSDDTAYAVSVFKKTAKMTNKQREAVGFILDGYSQVEAAKKLGVTQQAISERLRRAANLV